MRLVLIGCAFVLSVSLCAGESVTEYFISADHVRISLDGLQVNKTRSGQDPVETTYWPAPTQVWVESTRSLRVELLDDKGEPYLAFTRPVVGLSKPRLLGNERVRMISAEREEATQNLSRSLEKIKRTLRDAGKDKVAVKVNDSSVTVQAR